MAVNIDQEPLERLKAICAEHTNKLVFFVGSGLSRPAGIPVWNELKQKLLEIIDKKAQSIDIKDRDKIRIAMQYASSQESLWSSFELLKKHLGEADFRAAIRKEFSVADTCQIPEAYMQLWNLNVAGILTLNMDRLATRAFSARHPGKPFEEFPGNRAGKFAHLVKSRNPFVTNLHGIAADAESWVFTQSELDSLFKSNAYHTFVDACFLTHTVVFCGISADDRAAGGFLERLTKRGIDTGNHFWITNRNDLSTDTWAQEAGLQCIYYKAVESDHSELNDILKILESAVPRELIAEPVVASAQLVASDNHSPVDASPESIELLDPESLRVFLNTQATSILSSADSNRYQKYDDFCQQYDAAIHRAWYVRPGSDRDRLFGYKLLEKIGEGAFGQIYRADSPEGTQVAVKLLHESVRNEPERLQGFRRGVASMHILQQRNVKGAVAYHRAAEIPAFAVMDLIPGSNLSQAMTDYRVTDWAELLNIALQIVRIIRESHQLPERVLHRDLRPHNIMVMNPWDQASEWVIKILDFDLSWHRDAIEVSIEQPGATNGYLAPEMIKRQQGVSTRSALVDAYGIGMTYFFLASKRDPLPMESSHIGWKSTLAEEATKARCSKWKSFPMRFFRMIADATNPTQANRIDVVQIESETQRLADALVDNRLVLEPDLWAEELLARSSSLPYAASADGGAYTIGIGGLVLALKGLSTERLVQVDISWNQIGNEQYSSVRKWLPRALDKVNSQMRRSGWNGQLRMNGYQIDGSFTASVDELQREFDKFQLGLSETISACQFSG
jgi:serine/threonine protein kinase